MKVSFLRPVQVGSTLTCEAEVVSGGARVAFLEATLKAEDGKVMAKATSTYLFSSPPSGSSPL
jgi:acyl-coenzyme A thioesterase PaaI-like protein